MPHEILGLLLQMSRWTAHEYVVYIYYLVTYGIAPITHGDWLTFALYWFGM